jgi:hypothetical protein
VLPNRTRVIVPWGRSLLKAVQKIHTLSFAAIWNAEAFGRRKREHSFPILPLSFPVYFLRVGLMLRSREVSRRGLAKE